MDDYWLNVHVPNVVAAINNTPDAVRYSVDLVDLDDSERERTYDGVAQICIDHPNATFADIQGYEPDGFGELVEPMLVVQWARGAYCGLNTRERSNVKYRNDCFESAGKDREENIVEPTDDPTSVCTQSRPSRPPRLPRQGKGEAPGVRPPRSLVCLSLELIEEEKSHPTCTLRHDTKLLPD